MTWEKVIEIEPRLLELYNEAGNVNSSGTLTQAELDIKWHHEFKPAFKRILFAQGNTDLEQSLIIDLVYHKIRNKLEGKEENPVIYNTDDDEA